MSSQVESIDKKFGPFASVGKPKANHFVVGTIWPKPKNFIPTHPQPVNDPMHTAQTNG